MTVLASRRLQAVCGPAIAVIAIILCGWFASRALAALGPADAEAAQAAPAARAVTPEPAQAQPQVAARAVHDPAALVARNMFCSTCVVTDGGPAPEPGSGVARALPRVIATHVGSGGGGWATLEVAGIAGGFMAGAALPGGGVIERVERGAIVIAFGDGDTARVPLATDGASTGAAGGTRAPAGREPTPTAKRDPWADRVRAVGEHRWEVDRTLIRELVQAGTGASAAARGVRLQPVSKDGQLAGVRVSASRTGSLASALGLATGDVIESIDGQAIDSPQVLMKMYDRLGDLRRVDLGVRRRGANVTLTYDLP